MHDFGITADDVAYLVMDYVPGKTLAEVIKSEGQLGVSRTVPIFLQVCDALQHAHKLGVIHRDLKPSNIMIVQQEDLADFVKVLDFGVAKMLTSSADDVDQQRLTGTGEIFGSPIYMSPEQCQGDALDARSDVYALGCVIYETLTGKPPCVGKNAIETITRHITVKPAPFNEVRPDLYIPEWLEHVVFKALSKDPADRHQSMQELFDNLLEGIRSSSSLNQLKSLSTSIKTLAVDDTMQNQAQTQMRHTNHASNSTNNTNRIVLGSVLAITIAVVAYVGFTLFQQNWQHQAPPQQQSAPVAAAKPAPVAVVKTAPVKPSTAPAESSKPQGKALEPAKSVSAPVVQPATSEPTPSITPAPTTQKKTSTKTHKKHDAGAGVDLSFPEPVKHSRSSDYYDFEKKHEPQDFQ